MTERGLLMEVRGKKGIVLTRDGRFELVYLTGAVNVGDEIDIPAISRRSPWSTRTQAIAATLLIALMVSIVAGAVRVQGTAVAYVNVDIGSSNSSVELGVNRFNRVVSVEPLDNTGAEMLSGIELNRLNVEEAIAKVTDAAGAVGYMEPDSPDTVLITVTPAKKDGVVGSSLSGKVEKAKESVSKQLNDRNTGGSAEVIVATSEVREQARLLKIPPGRLAIMLKEAEKAREAVRDNRTGDDTGGASGTGGKSGTGGTGSEGRDRENKPPVNEPEDGRRVDGAGDKPSEKGPGDTKPADTKPADTKPTGEKRETGDSSSERPDRNQPDGGGQGRTRQDGEEQGPGKSTGKKDGKPAGRSQRIPADIINEAKSEKDWNRLLKKFGDEIRENLSRGSGSRGSEDRGRGEDEDKPGTGSDDDDRRGHGSRNEDGEGEDRGSRGGSKTSPSLPGQGKQSENRNTSGQDKNNKGTTPVSQDRRRNSSPSSRDRQGGIGRSR